ncbi:HEPN domain-containing protein [Jiangella endophytica]|uniref:HEPN domain-containing protein n=1 Tax=Jiangella endophytica TaxID=1623398 RepID=UPI000E35043D|nr:HEPN domain-containing protein [Jiangella endophytica]
MGYVAGVVSLYGLLEQSIDEIILEVAANYNKLHQSFLTMPERVRNEFKSLALNSIIDGPKSRLRADLDEDDIFVALNSRSTSSLRRLVPAVFTRAQANYRHPLICELIARLDVKLDERGLVTAASLAKTGMASVSSLLVDLVDRRNSLTHAYSIQDDILRSQRLLEYLDVLEQYLLSVESVANLRLLDELVATGNAPRIGIMAKKYTDFIGVDLVGANLAIGDALLFQGKTGIFKGGRVTSLMADNVARDSVIAGVNEVVQLGVGMSDGPPRLGEGAAVHSVAQQWVELLPEA